MESRNYGRKIQEDYRRVVTLVVRFSEITGRVVILVMRFREIGESQRWYEDSGRL